MTDEEMAEEYENAQDYCGLLDVLSEEQYNQDYGGLSCYISPYIEQAYLAGLKAGRPEWHKVADGDLPKNCRYGTRTSEYVLVKFKSGNTGVCYFDFDLLGWFANGYPEQLKNIIAWCEIPKYTEE